MQNEKRSNRTTQRLTKEKARHTGLLALAAAASAVATLSTSASAANLTWTGAVNNTWNATATSFTADANWSSGGSATVYNVRDDAVFTDNFAGPTGINVGTLSATAGDPNSMGMNPTSLSFRHIAGSTPTTYIFNRLREDGLTNNSTPFGAATSSFGGGTVSVTLEAGFLGGVAIQTRANSQSFGTTTINSGVLEINDALALPANVNSSGTLNANMSVININNGGQLNINVTTGGNFQPASTNLAGTLTVNGSGTLALAATNDGGGGGANTTSLNGAAFTTVDSRAYNGTITIAGNSTLTLNSLSGGQMNFTSSGTAANIDMRLSEGTLQLAGSTRARFDNARGSMPKGSLNLGTGASIFSTNFGNVTGTFTIGALSGGASTRLLGSQASNAGIIDTYLIGTKDVDSTFDGTIGDGTAATNAHLVNVAKGGTGVVTLTNANTYTGATIATAGTISVATIGGGGVASNAGAGTNVVLSGGAIRYTGTGNSSNRTLTVTPTGGTLDSAGSGALALTSATNVSSDAANRGGTIQAASNVIDLTVAPNNGVGNTSDLVVGMTITNAAVFNAPVTITAIGNGTVTVSAPADNVGTNSTMVFGPANRTLTLTGANGGANAIGGVLADSAGGGLLAVSKTAAGNWSIGGANTYTGGTSVSGGVLTVTSSGLVGPGPASVSGSTLNFAAGNVTAQKVSSLGISSVSHVDANDNDMVVGSATSKATIEGYIATARNFGGWNGASGITSTSARTQASQATMLGVLSGAEYTSVGGTGTFSGQPYVAGDTLVKYTWYGDTDFNGSVDFDDYVRTDGGFNGALTGWLNGDFDLNGSVDFDDYVLIDLGFNSQSGTLRRAQDWLSGDDRSMKGMNSPALQKIVEHFNQFGSQYGGNFLAAVPEPTTIGAIGLIVAGGLLGRRRRSW